MNEFPFPPQRLSAEHAATIEWMGKLQQALDERLKAGAGSPEGVVTANRGCLYQQTDGGAVWVKASGDGLATGWTLLT